MRRVIQNKPDYTPGSGQGERNMNEAVHLAVHLSVHLCGERKLRGAMRLRVTRRLILYAGKTPDWAGATPLRCHRNRGGVRQPREGSKSKLGDRAIEETQ